MQMLYVYSGTSPSTVSMDASRMDVKMDKSPRRSSLNRPESPPHTARSLRLHRSLRPDPTGVSARPASTSTHPRVTAYRCPDLRQAGDYPESPPRPDCPARTDRRLRPKAGLRALMGPRPMYLCPDFRLITSPPLGRGSHLCLGTLAYIRAPPTTCNG